MTKTDTSSDCYDLLSNAAGDLVLIIGRQDGEPDESARLVYDGGPEAILYRNRESALEIRSLEETARKPLIGAKEILIAELTEGDTTREYKIPVCTVKNIAALKQQR